MTKNLRYIQCQYDKSNSSIIWKMKDGEFDKEQRAQEIKTALEGLEGKIEGLVKMRIITEKLDSSSGDVFMDSTFVSNEALKFYQNHPLHKEVANGLVRPSMEQRLSYDYEE